MIESLFILDSGLSFVNQERMGMEVLQCYIKMMKVE